MGWIEVAMNDPIASGKHPGSFCKGESSMKYILGLMLFFVFGVAQAALVDRGGGFIYDDVLDITWTQSANINGPGTWENRVAWADSLSLYDSVRDVTWDDWRLASVDVNNDNTVVNCAIDDELACRDNELGYLFFQNGVSYATPGLFNSIQDNVYYWSGTAYAGYPALAWFIFFGSGTEGGISKTSSNYAWAVRDGDVAAVPVPAAVWLFSSALFSLVGIKRKK